MIVQPLNLHRTCPNFWLKSHFLFLKLVILIHIISESALILLRKKNTLDEIQKQNRKRWVQGVPSSLNGTGGKPRALCGRGVGWVRAEPESPTLSRTSDHSVASSGLPPNAEHFFLPVDGDIGDW